MYQIQDEFMRTCLMCRKRYYVLLERHGMAWETGYLRQIGYLDKDLLDYVLELRPSSSFTIRYICGECQNSCKDALHKKKVQAHYAEKVRKAQSEFVPRGILESVLSALHTSDDGVMIEARHELAPYLDRWFCCYGPCFAYAHYICVDERGERVQLCGEHLGRYLTDITPRQSITWNTGLTGEALSDREGEIREIQARAFAEPVQAPTPVSASLAHLQDVAHLAKLLANSMNLKGRQRWLGHQGVEVCIGTLERLVRKFPDACGVFDRALPGGLRD